MGAEARAGFHRVMNLRGGSAGMSQRNDNTGWHSPEYEALLDKAAIQTDPAQRLEIFKQAEHMLMDAQPIAPIGFRGRNYLLRPEVKNWHPLLLDNHPWGAISLEP